MPNGIYSGFATESKDMGDVPTSIVALVRMKDTKELHLILRAIDNNRNENVYDFSMQEILNILAINKDKVRNVPQGIDNCNEESIQRLINAMQSWIREKVPIVDTDETFDELQGSASSSNKTKASNEDRYEDENLELICWEYIHKQ